MASPLQRMRGGREDSPASSRLHVQRRDAGARVLARATAGYRVRRQVCRQEHPNIP